MDQYLNLFLLYLVYYILFSNIKLLKVFTSDYYYENMKVLIKNFFPNLPNYELDNYISYLKFFSIFSYLLPLLIYVSIFFLILFYFILFYFILFYFYIYRIQYFQFFYKSFNSIKIIINLIFIFYNLYYFHLMLLLLLDILFFDVRFLC